MKKLAILLAAGFIALTAIGCDSDGCHSIQHCGSLYNQGYTCDGLDGCYQTKSACQSDPACQ